MFLNKNKQKSFDIKYPAWSPLNVWFCNRTYSLYFSLNNQQSFIKIPADIKIVFAKKSFCLLSKSKHTSLVSLATVIKNKIFDLHNAFSVLIKIQGVNFKFLVKDNLLVLDLGKSYQVKIFIPKYIFIETIVTIKDIFVVKGFDRLYVLNFVYYLLKQKPINIYTGSGLFLANTKIKLKEGKKK